MKVRFLKVGEIDDAVNELLRDFCRKRSCTLVAPVPVEDILEKHLKVKLEITDLVKLLDKPDVLGAAWFDLGIVRVDERIVDQEGRYGFTVSHELGHWILHRPQVEAQRAVPTLFDEKCDEPAFVCRTSEKKAPAEWQADQFAARLLMPTQLVQTAFAVACGSSALEIDGLSTRRDDTAVQARWRDVARTVIDSGKFSNVSNEAMRYRLSDLRLVRDVGLPLLIS